MLTAATLGLCVVLVWRPETGLALTWAVLVPGLPLLFLVAPRVWRNVCPFALANQLPRIAGLGHARPAPAWIAAHGFTVAAVAFIGLVTLRKVALDSSGPATAAVILSFLGLAFLGGVLVRGKAGWCGTVCPLYPVQRVYGRAPLAQVEHAHCRPCVGCMHPCGDLDPPSMTAFEHSGKPEARARWLFIGAAPGLVVGYFATPGPPSVPVAVAAAGVVAPPVLSAAVYALLATGLRVTTEARRRALAGGFAAAAFALFYVYAAPRTLAVLGVDRPAAVTVVQAVAVAAAVAWWVRDQRRTVRHPTGQVWLGTPRLTAERAETVVRFLGADGARHPIAVEVGESLAVAARRAGVPVPTGCGVGNCGVDAMTVLTGRHHLSDATPEERETLRRYHLPEGTRLACVARVTGEVTVTPHAPAAAPPTPVNPHVHRVVIIGNGIAGLTAAEHVRRLSPSCEVYLVGRESYHTYNRMALTDLVTGHQDVTELGLLPDDWFEEHRITAPLGTQAVGLDVAAHEVVLDNGERLSYSRLILATGATPVYPPIEGLPLAGAHLLRTAEDALSARDQAGSHPDLRSIVVLGAGPLGVETAVALTRLGTPVTLIDREAWPLYGLVDERAGELVRAELTRLGVAVETGVTVRQAYGSSRIAAVGLSDGRQLPCDALLMCTGVRPNVELARAAGLSVQHGVIVDRTMRTSHPHVFAVGDVAEFRSKVTGLWYAAVEQATVAAEQAVARQPSEARQYRPGAAVTRLELSDLSVVSIGRTEPKADDHAVVTFDEPAQRQYRKIIVAADGTVPGGVVVNDPEAVAAIESAVAARADIRALLDELRGGDLLSLTTATTRRPVIGRLVWVAVGSAAALVAVATVAAASVLGDALVTARDAAPPTPVVASSPQPAAGQRAGTGAATSPATGPSPGTGAAPAPGTGPGAAPGTGAATAPAQAAGPAAAAQPPPVMPPDPRINDVLLHPNITWSDEARRTLLAGGADARLLALLVALAADHRIAISALPDVPGARPDPARRAVAISAVDGAPLTGPRANEIARWFNAQQAPYRPVAVLVTTGNNPALFVALDGSVSTRPAGP